jgi:integrase
MAKRLRRGYWWRSGYIHTRDPVTGKRTSTGCVDPTAAELWRAGRERIAADPIHARASTATLGRWSQRVLAVKTAERKEGTAHMYGVKLGQLNRLLGSDTPMSAFNPPEGGVLVDAYIAKRRDEGVKPNTIGHELVALRQVLKYAKRAGEYGGDISAVMPIGFSREYEPVERVLAEEDLAKLFAALRSDEQRAWVCMALVFAADPADVHRMRPEDYDPAQALFHVRGTKNRARDAWLPIIDEFRELFEYAYPLLPLNWDRASKGVPEACLRAGIPHVSPKDLRRTTITWMAEHGVAQDMASRFARHIGDQMVRKIYARVKPRALGRIIRSQLGTSQSHFTGPLGEIGIRRGLKRPSGPPAPYWGGRKCRRTAA